MSKPSPQDLRGYKGLVENISATFRQGQQKTVAAINSGLVMTYWQIGKLANILLNLNSKAKPVLNTVSNCSVT